MQIRDPFYLAHVFVNPVAVGNFFEQCPASGDDLLAADFVPPVLVAQARSVELGDEPEVKWQRVVGAILDGGLECRTVGMTVGPDGLDPIRSALAAIDSSALSRSSSARSKIPANASA